jgi:hypothetical protein
MLDSDQLPPPDEAERTRPSQSDTPSPLTPLPKGEGDSPSAPPTLRPRDIMLLDFLREHDAACPVCGYNVRALTRPVCPECKQQLTLTVGAERLHMGWLFAAVAPGFFSGIAAMFVLIPTLGRPLFGDGRWEPLIVALDLFGWCSGIFAIILVMKRARFMALPRARQMWIALIIWFIHIAALGLFILSALGVVYF